MRKPVIGLAGKKVTDSFVHIGSNDVFGRELRNNWNVPTYSHTDIANVPICKNTLISISAFNPKRKSIYDENCEFLSEVMNKCQKDTKVIYFSSCRVLDYKSSLGVKTPYVLNKLADEKKLLDKFENMSIVYLPNIIPKYTGQTSRFFEIFFRNLKNKKISFDVVDHSKWNFVQVHDVVEQIFEFKKFGKYEQILSPTDITVTSLAQKFNSSDIRVEFGERYEEYPRVRLDKVRYCKNDTAKDVSWLEDVRRIYEN